MMMTIKKAGGFTLIEVMVALTTLAIGLLAVMGLYFSSIRADTRNRDESRAMFLANQMVEELRSRGFKRVEESLQGYECEPGGCGCDIIDGYFERQWCFTTPQAWRKDVVVTVRWPLGEPPEKQKKVRVATIIVQLD